MANNIKGITVEIGGDVGPLTTALKGVNKTAGDLQSELREVNKQLKFDPKNTELLTQKMDILKQNTQALQEKQATLKEAVAQAQAQFEKGDLGAEKVRAVEREYEKVTSQLKDTKSQLRDVESSVGSFSEKVKAKFSSIKDSIKNAFSSENIKTALGAIGTATGLFLKGSLEEAEDAEKANADLAQTLQSTGSAAGMTMESLEELSGSLSKSTTFSNDQVKSGESMLLTFTNIGKDVFPQATSAVLDFAQKMGTDPKNAALTLGKALNDPTDGLSKLTRSGVTFTESQKKQIEAMQKSGDTAGAQKLMLQELNKEFGGQASSAADTYSGKQKQLKNDLTEVKETIGTALMPVLAKIMEKVTPIIQGIMDFVTQHPKLTAGILAVITVLGILVGGLSILTTVMSALAVAQTVALGPILLVVAAIAALVAIAALIITHWQQVSDFFVGLWNSIQSLFAGIGQWFSSVFSAAANAVQSAWSGITGFFSGIWSGIKSVFSAVGSWFSSIFSAAWSAIKSIWSGVTSFFSGIWSGIKSVFSAVGSWFSSIFKTAWSGIKSAWSGVTGFFSGIWSGITSVFSNIAGWFSDKFNAAVSAIKSIFKPDLLTNIGHQLIEGLWNGIKSAEQWILDKLSAFKDAILNGLKKFFGIKSPSTLFRDEIGKNLALGIGQGFTDNIGSALTSITASVKNVTATVSSAIPSTFSSSMQVSAALSAANGADVGSASSSLASGTGSAASSSSGVTFHQEINNYSPTALSPAETARQTRNATRQLILSLSKG